MPALTDQEIEHFRSEGYVVVDDVISQEEVLDPLEAEYATVLDRLASGSLPAGYLEALFSPLDTDDDAEAVDAKAIEAYRAVSDDAWSMPASGGDGKAARWTSSGDDA